MNRSIIVIFIALCLALPQTHSAFTKRRRHSTNSNNPRSNKRAKEIDDSLVSERVKGGFVQPALVARHQSSSLSPPSTQDEDDDCALCM
eukprot:CAMPEP_0198117370 /NCGR_PEP_ID=MMETSP1442-20131203/17859_1 /TAXON_ID= /ORGANISM="Craspedostauros australis, Strain CCMP3328" /LENGTH=88 /DNA_ID=CAMNT_0043775407 /DNA_START=52 /DNA_END=318 /DNA_ORIENTATION=+